MKKFLLYGHGGSYNHGAEAIIKCTIRELREQHKDARIILSSNFPEQDREFGVDADEFIAPDLVAWEEEKTAPKEKKEELARKMYANALASITPDTTLLSIGGDNYCYPTWHRLAVFQREAIRQGAKSILWSASIEPSAMTPEMIEILSTYDRITARESLTYEALRAADVQTDIELTQDVAFALEPEPVDTPVCFGDGTFIGVNLSPLIIRSEKVSGIIMRNFINLVTYIAEKTEYLVALVPHVVMPMDNDHNALTDLHQALPDSIKERVWLVSDRFSAAQYKYIISQCRAMVAARTHASIAAYSTNVPCLAIGYSVKARGIAKDLGKSDFVICVSGIYEEDHISKMFIYMLNNKITPCMSSILVQKTTSFAKQCQLPESRKSQTGWPVKQGY